MARQARDYGAQIVWAEATGLNQTAVSRAPSWWPWASPRTFQVLERLCRRNRLMNVTLVNCAIADAPGAVFIDDHDLDEANTTSPQWGPGRRREPVEAATH